MKFQDQVLAHMRERFPAATFTNGPDVGKRGFNPEVSMSIRWLPEDPTINAELERFCRLHQFCSGLEALAHETGVVVFFPRLTICRPGEIDSRYHYVPSEAKLSDGTYQDIITWQQELDS